MRYHIRQLAGGLVNGSPGGAQYGARLFHCVPVGKVEALCGARPGLWSTAWSSEEGPAVTCLACQGAVLLLTGEASES